MAKAKTNPLDLSVFAGGTTSGRATANPLDLSVFVDPEFMARRENATAELDAQANAIIQDFAARGEPLTETEIGSLFQALASGETWTRPTGPDFSNVRSGSSTVTLPERTQLGQEVRELGAVADVAQAAVQDFAAGAAIKAADSPEQIKQLTKSIPQLSGLSGLAELVLPETEQEKQKWMDASVSFAGAAEANRDLAEPIKQEAMARGGEAWRQYVETVFDVAGSPSSAASLIGGPAAAIPFADVYMREYGAARRAGLSPEDADMAAMAQAVPEGVISAIPSGKLLGKIGSKVPGVSDVLERTGQKLASSLESRMGKALNTAITATTTAAGEGLEEGVTTIAQDAARRVQGLVGPEKAREYAQQNALDSGEYWSEVWRSVRAGAAMGGPIGSLEGAMTSAQEGARLSAEREERLTTAIDTELGNRLLANAQARDKADVEITQDIALEEERIAAEEAQRQAFEQAEREAAEQRDLEVEAGFQTLERGEVAPTSRVERYADVVERVPVEPAREVRPEDVAEQRAAAQRAADEQAERVQQGKLTEELRKRREAAAKKEATAQKKQTSEQKKAEKKRREFVADQVLTENPDATESELTAEFERRLADDTIQPPADTTPQPTLEDRVGQVRARMEAAKKGKVTKMQNERIKAVVRRNPDLSVEEIADQLRQEGVATEGQAAPIVEATPDRPAPANVIPEPTKTDKSQTEAELEDLSQKMGLSLGMAATKADLRAAGAKRRGTEEVVAEEPQPTVEEYAPKIKAFVKSLVGRTSKDSRDVQTLIHQGKIVVAPNAKFLGRKEAGRQAEYDTADGKMYIYLDNISDLSDPVSHIATALHETTHALADPETVNSASGKIRVAANNGNRLAQAAVRQAQADTSARDGDDTFENEEVVAYFASEVKAAEGKPLGTVSAIARNLVSNAKAALREHVGLDLDVSIGDVATALNAGLSEATQRDIRGRGTDGTLAMIYNMNSAGAQEAIDNGWVYDSVDGRQKYVLSDSDATLKDGARVRLRDTNNPPKLSDVLDHEVLYREHPEARDIPLYVVDEIPGFPTAFGSYDSAEKAIWLTKAAVSSTDPFQTGLKEGLMHEIQHYVQDAGGYLNQEAYADTPAIVATKTKWKKANDKQKAAARKMLDEVPAAVRGQLDSRGNRELADIVFDTETSDVVKASQLSEMLQDYDVELPATASSALNSYDDARADRNALLDDYNAALNTANENYLANITEREAFRTQEDLDLPEEEVRARGTPEPQMAEQSTDFMPRTSGRIDVPETSFAARFREAAGTQALGMAAQRTQTPEAKAARRAPLWFTSIFRNDKGLGREINALVENARTSPAADRMRAEASLGSYDAAIKLMAREQGVTAKELSDKIAEELDAVDSKSNSYDANKAEFISVARKYGKAGEALIDLRNQVDDLTMHILRQRAQQGGILTEAEKKRYTTLLSNMGRYTHRMYVTHQRAAGKKFADQLWSAYEAKRKGKKLSATEEANYQTIANAIKYLIDDTLMIPDDAGLAEMGSERLRRMYRTWGTENPDALSLDQIRDDLALRRAEINGNTDKLRRAAEDITKELINIAGADPTTPIASYYRGSKQDTGILQERTHMPAPIRAVMGELTSPGVRLLATVGKQAEFVARNKMLLEMRKFVGTDLQPPGSAGSEIVSANSLKELSGEGWGPLEGWYASDNMKGLIGDTIQQLVTFEQAAAMASTKPDELLHSTIRQGIEKWARVAGISKMLQIVGNPFNFIMNFMGAFRMLVSNGNINPKHTLRAWKTSSDLIAYAINPKAVTEAARIVNTYGVTDSAFIGDLKNLDYRQIQKAAKDMAGIAPSKWGEQLHKLVVGGKELYAMMDVWSKIANFYHQVDVLTDFYKANNQKVDQETIYREAADIVNKTNITYKRAAPFVKALERGGITQFGTYFYEVFRSELGNVHQAFSEWQRAKEASTPEAANMMRIQGAKRFAGQTASWAAVYYMAQGLQQLAFGDDEDDKYLRKLLPEFVQNQDLLPIGKDGEGNVVFFNVSRLDPIGPMTDILREGMQPDSDVGDLAKQFLDLYVAPRVGTQLLVAGATTVGAGRPTREPLVQQLFPSGYGAVLGATDFAAVGPVTRPWKDKAVQAWTNVGEAFLPGMLTSWRESNARPIGDDVQSQMYSALSYMGAYMYKLDPKAAARRAGFVYKDTMSDARKDIASFFRSRPEATAKETLGTVLDLRESEKEQWDNLSDIYKGMEQAGLSDKEASAAMKAGGVPVEVIGQLRRNRFESVVISKKSIDGYARREIEKETSKNKKEEVEDMWNNVWDVLKQVQEETE